MKSITRKSLIVLGVIAGLCFALCACAPQAASNAGGGSAESEATPAGLSGDWTIDADCAMCHAEEAASMDDAALLASDHIAYDCSMCHTEADIAPSHEGVTAPPDEEQQRALRKAGRTMGTSEFCLQCHGTLQELAEKTVDVTLVKDANGTVVNPHAIPENAKHEEAGVQECYNCHWLHNPLPSPVSNCNSCHHQGVFECGTCHSVED